MNLSRNRLQLAALAAIVAMLAACSGKPDTTTNGGGTAGRSATAPAAPASAAAAVASAPTAGAGGAAVAPEFTPPPASSIPDDAFGAMVRKGEQIFTDTPQYASAYVGNGLSCQNCHLDAGRRANSAPMWAAWVRYPRFRSKNNKINSFTERLQGCFRFSQNGKPPPADSEIIKALASYSYWLATGAPTGKDLAGAGYPKQGFTPPQPPSYARGKQVFTSHCALCHGDDGQGRKVAGRYVFPPLWGPDSFNWGAGMHQLNNAAAFIKANMPFSRGGTLSDQQAWDVAMYMDSHERPQDPRFDGSVAETRAKYHDTKWSLYGKEVNGHLLGSLDDSTSR
ncbi:MAG TPA: c-type cytochrome [Rhodanobacteraceae bacterium]|nr:c-type cytochrome [Rhodanobacteraceae bacterium]